MRAWFTNISVSSKLGIGFGLVLALTGILAMVGWSSLDKLIWRGERTADISRLDNTLLNLRAIRLRYIASDGDEQIAVQMDEQIERFSKLYAEVSPNFQTSKNQSLLKSQWQQFDSYQASFSEMRRNFQVEQRAVAQIKAQAQRLEQALAEVGAGVINISIYGDSRVSHLQALFHFNDAWRTARLKVQGYVAHLEGYDDQAAIQSIVEAKKQQQLFHSALSADYRTAVETVAAALDAYSEAAMAYKVADEQIALANEEIARSGNEIMRISGELVEHQNYLRDNEVSAARVQQLVAILLAVLAGLSGAWLITRQITRPLSDALEAVERIADGDLRQSLEISRTDEIGALLQGVQRMGATLRELIGGIRDGVSQIASAAEELSAVTEQTSAGVNNQKVETDQVATAMHEMSATVQEVAHNAANAAQAANSADFEAEEGGRVVNQAVAQIELLANEVNRSSTAMGQLQQESHKIGSVMDVIKAVAEQTNLLALNAAIEAARAGEAGRGFAVVADEVRGLAQRTQKSTEEIEELVAGLQQGTQQVASIMHSSRELTESSVVLTRKAGESLCGITRAVSNIQSMNQQIAAAAEQQSAVAEEISRSVINVRDISEQSASASNETAKSSQELARLGNRLQSMVSHFRV